MRPILQNSREVLLVGSDGNLLVDEVDNALVTVDFPHHEVHEGNTFLAFWKSPDGSDVADNAAFGLYLQLTSKTAHFTFDVAGGGDTEVALWENATFSATGTVATPYNLNRMSAKATTVGVRTGPTLVTGTLIENFLEPGGTGPSQSSGGVGRRGTEWILRTGTAYYLQGINRAGSAQPASAMAQWYEEEA